MNKNEDGKYKSKDTYEFNHQLTRVPRDPSHRYSKYIFIWAHTTINNLIFLFKYFKYFFII